jgi:DAACS family dicarboxylate/amino acid:cation (Na+ or H+) symporter
MTAAILVAMALGLVVGPLLGSNAAPLGELGKLVISLIKAVATPLLFLAIVNAVVQTEVDRKAGTKMLGIATINACLALAIGIGISNAFHPGAHLGQLLPAPDPAALALYRDKEVDFLATFIGYVPTNLVSPFLENLVISVVILALLFGLGFRRVKREQLAKGERSYEPVEQAIQALLRLVEIVLGWTLLLVPLGVFGVVARTVGEHGYAPLRGLLAYVAAGLGGLALHALLVYHAWLLFYARLAIGRFWAAAREPVITALGTNSSLATLPVTLRALDSLGVSRASSALGACVGTNLNNDGILLYEGMAVLFVAQASGLDLTLAQQLLVAVTALVAAMGVAGVPEAGFVSLALVLNTVKLPIEILPLLLTVDWVIARGRSVVNVLSDMVLSIAIEGPQSTRRT